MVNQVPTGGDAMNNDNLDRQIEELERFLNREDPSLSKRFIELERASTRNVVSVASLLVISVVLLGIGLATLSFVAFGSGTVAFIGSFIVDGLHHRRLRNQSARGGPLPGASMGSGSSTTSSFAVVMRELHPSRRLPPFPDSSSYQKRLIPLFATVDRQPRQRVSAHGGMSCIWTYCHRPRSVHCSR